MSLVLQFGEFYSNSDSLMSNIVGYFVSFLGVIITGILAIWIFNRRLKADKKLNEEVRIKGIEDKQEEKRRELVRLRDYIVLLSENVIDNVIRQVEHFEEYATHLEKDPTTNHIINIISQENLERLSKLDNKMLHEIFWSVNQNVESFSLYVNNIDYILGVINMVHYDIKEGNGKDVSRMMNKIIEIRSNILELLSDHYDELKRKNPDYKKLKFWNTINIFLHNYYEGNTGFPSITWDSEKLIEPVRNELIKEEYLDLSIRNNVLKQCMYAGNTIFSIKEFNNATAKKLTIDCKGVRKACIEIKETIDILQNEVVVTNKS